MREGWGEPHAQPAPDWDEIEARAQRIYADAVCPEFLALATREDAAGAIRGLCLGDTDNIVGLESLMARLPPSPGIARSVGLWVRRNKLARLGELFIQESPERNWRTFVATLHR